jgi:hypothetical protein
MAVSSGSIASQAACHFPRRVPPFNTGCDAVQWQHFLIFLLFPTSSFHRPLPLPTQDVAVSSGSACTSASLEPSYVLRALGVEEDMAHTSIRFGFGRFTTVEEVDR